MNKKRKGLYRKKDSLKINKPAYAFALIVIMVISYGNFLASQKMENYLQLNMSSVVHSTNRAAVILKNGCYEYLLPVAEQDGYFLENVATGKLKTNGKMVPNFLLIKPIAVLIKNGYGRIEGEISLQGINWLTIGIRPVDGIAIALAQGAPIYVEKQMISKIC